jgi:hypothetical protein
MSLSAVMAVSSRPRSRSSATALGAGSPFAPCSVAPSFVARQFLAVFIAVSFAVPLFCPFLFAVGLSIASLLVACSLTVTHSLAAGRSLGIAFSAVIREARPGNAKRQSYRYRYEDPPHKDHPAANGERAVERRDAAAR